MRKGLHVSAVVLGARFILSLSGGVDEASSLGTFVSQDRHRATVLLRNGNHLPGR